MASNVYPGDVIKLGSLNSTAIRTIKTRLVELDYKPLDPSNPTFGENTEAKVKEFQEYNQLQDDGIVGRLTWERLFSARADSPVNSEVLRFRALEIMNTQLFVREKTGKNDGAEVKAYLNSVGFTEGYAWCQAFVYWAFDKAAKELGVPNPMPRTAGVLDHFAKAKAKGITIVYDNPLKGDIFIMDFGGGKGHIGMVEANFLGTSTAFTVEGNTNGEGSREGDGVYERSRNKNLIKAYLRYE